MGGWELGTLLSISWGFAISSTISTVSRLTEQVVDHRTLLSRNLVSAGWDIDVSARKRA